MKCSVCKDSFTQSYSDTLEEREHTSLSSRVRLHTSSASASIYDGKLSQQISGGMRCWCTAWYNLSQLNAEHFRQKVISLADSSEVIAGPSSAGSRKQKVAGVTTSEQRLWFETLPLRVRFSSAVASCVSACFCCGCEWCEGPHFQSSRCFAVSRLSGDAYLWPVYFILTEL